MPQGDFDDDNMREFLAMQADGFSNMKAAGEHRPGLTLSHIYDICYVFLFDFFKKMTDILTILN